MTDFPAADLSRVHSAAHVQFTQDRLMKMLALSLAQGLTSDPA